MDGAGVPLEEPQEDKIAATYLKLSESDATELRARLSALTQAARIFGSAMSGLDVQVTWSLKPNSGRVLWSQEPSGRRSVKIQLDLNHVITLITRDNQEEGTRFVDIFKAGFLHELGHILYSATTDAFPGESGRTRVLEAVWHTLEDARIERGLILNFKGARRYLEGHPEQMSEIARSSAKSPGLAQLLALLFLQIWGAEDMVDDATLSPEIVAIAERLRDSLRIAVERDTSSALASWVSDELVPELDGFIDLDVDKQQQMTRQGNELASEGEQDSESQEPGSTEGSDQRQGGDQRSQPRNESGLDRSQAPSEDLARVAEEIEEELTAPTLLFAKGETEQSDAGQASDRSWIRSRIISYPHVDGSMILDEVAVARASEVEETEKTRTVVGQFARFYGPLAADAFANEDAALRRAFQVNFESRFGGRYVSGKHIGVSNLRRFVVNQDLRLFQRMERPDRLSYYIHLLLDVSPSMLTNHNLQKALAVGYAFAASLERLRVPVDVTLYSSALTELHVHRRDPLERFFGGRFSYLSAGTHEIEAISYAKLQADQATEERKIIVVTTDGRPNSSALTRTGAKDLKTYYHETLTPWLRKSGIDLLAIGIGSPPSYHPNAAAISSGWESVVVFMRLLDEIIDRGTVSHAALWR